MSGGSRWVWLVLAAGAAACGGGGDRGEVADVPATDDGGDGEAADAGPDGAVDGEPDGPFEAGVDGADVEAGGGDGEQDETPGDGDDAEAAGEAEAGREWRVLFVGNSYTYVNDLPGQVAALAAGGERAIVVDSVTVGGATLADHGTSTGAVAAIRRGGWDFVVLQGQSVEPLYDRAGFLAGAAGLAEEIAAVGAEPVFFETWARRADSEVYAESWSGGTPAAMQARLREAYGAAAVAAGGRLAPAGDAWERSLSEHPDLVLHAEDGSHPSMAGSYLAACVFLGLLTGRDPRTAAWSAAGLSGADAETLREIAATTLEP